jgi:hypothetical protein
MNGCKKKEEKSLSCEELLTNYSTTLTAFITTPTEATCDAFEKAAQDYLNGCALLSPAEKQQVQQSLDENDCSEYGSGK